MEKLIILVLFAMLSVSLAGCATKGYDSTEVKCPSCGYEFEIPENVGG